MWHISYRADREVLPLADAHYNRQKPGTSQFVPPGRCLVLKEICSGYVSAFWVTSWPEFASHEWAGAWVCTAFRNVGARLSSLLITDAVAATRFVWPNVPRVRADMIGANVGIVSFINSKKVRSKKNPGYCYLQAGWEYIGKTKSGLFAVGQRPERMPAPCRPYGMQLSLFGGAA